MDTNVLVIYSRSSDLADKIEADHQIFSGDHNLAISVVTIGELNSLMEQNKYGKRRKRDIERMLEKVFRININIERILELYGKIDAYSQGKSNDKKLEVSARNMGKNDLWIAATASAYDMILVTTDKDFKHLNDVFLKVKYIDPELYKK